MKLLSGIVEFYNNAIEFKRKKKAQSALLNERAEQFPTCILSNGCKLLKTELGKHVAVHGNTVLQKVTVGDHTYFSPKSIISHVIFGNFCSIGTNVVIGLSRHPSSNFVSTYPAFFSKKNKGCLETFVTESKFNEMPHQTFVGNDVWIGDNVTIPGGVSIESGAIIAAGSVVTKDVPAYGVYGGNPAKLIRYRFAQEDIKFLLNMAWWDWSEDKILRLADTFDDLSKFRAEIIKETK